MGIMCIRQRASRWSVAAVIAVAAVACDQSLTTPSSGSPESRLRITLSGTSRIDNLIVQFPDARVTFGTLQGGTTSAYQEVPTGVYRYAAYQYVLDGVAYRQPVIDWVGEQPMEGRAFTYVLEVLPPGSFRRNQPGERDAQSIASHASRARWASALRAFGGPRAARSVGGAFAP